MRQRTSLFSPDAICPVFFGRCDDERWRAGNDLLRRHRNSTWDRYSHVRYVRWVRPKGCAGGAASPAVTIPIPVTSRLA